MMRLQGTQINGNPKYEMSRSSLPPSSCNCSLLVQNAVDAEA